VWYAFNVTVVLSNKYIFTRLPLPTSLTLLHQTTGFVLSSLLLAMGFGSANNDKNTAPEDGRFERMKRMLPVALANTGAMYFSNLSMKYASAPFTQTIKSSVPAFTYLIYTTYWKKTYHWEHKASLLLVCAGVIVASSADVSMNVMGLSTAILASILTASNAVLAGDTGKKLSPLESMNVMAPYSIAMLLPVWWNTELVTLYEYWDQVFNPVVFPLLMAHGVLVFMLNYVSNFKTAVVSPVLGTCAGNMKVVFIYMFSWLLLGTELNFLIWIGASMTIGGGIWKGLLGEGFRLFGMEDEDKAEKSE
jgi:drug/metabolite transporter (DMT)-like permease